MISFVQLRGLCVFVLKSRAHHLSKSIFLDTVEAAVVSRKM
jgi:hypothetical protein